MDCRQVAEWQGLRPETQELRDALSEHLRSCSACAALHAHISSFDALLRGNLIVAPPPELSLRLLALARAAAVPRQVVSGAIVIPHSSPAPLWRQLAAFALAAVAAIALGEVLGYRGWEMTLNAALDLSTAFRVVLTSPVSWLLPETDTLLADAWGFLPAAALADTWGFLPAIASAMALIPLAWWSRVVTAREPSGRER